ncbi:hypothetical protein [Frankia sp. AgKG'84/4]|uniref:hypothetical protein n=1 Tax=Frankia sp. AgKG'84/4 TaxID=573490 RepID=UPI00202ABC9B|nr:hypothetical protein [Frankia sp. AgKG'84/4]MCL9796857.1 hypothetical protein [Frankia sp. AgKG'84/4]
MVGSNPAPAPIHLLLGTATLTGLTITAVALGWVPWPGLLEQVLAELLVLTGITMAGALWRATHHQRDRPRPDSPPAPSPD